MSEFSLIQAGELKEGDIVVWDDYAKWPVEESPDNRPPLHCLCPLYPCRAAEQRPTQAHMPVSAQAVPTVDKKYLS